MPPRAPAITAKMSSSHANIIGNDIIDQYATPFLPLGERCNLSGYYTSLGRLTAEDAEERGGIEDERY